MDDDVRNIFALTTVLEQHGLQVVHAENGRAGIEMLLKTPGIDGVLMDIMMPEMDGYETMRAIRQIAEFRSLPIIAVTAKAMKGDRAKCIEAGASDYITKPVDLDQLFSVLRVWLVRGHERVAGSHDGRGDKGRMSGRRATRVQPAREPAVERRIKILLVDDTPENLVSLEAALGGLGEELVLANSGKEALRHVLNDDFAAILLDVRMPDMDGFETAELIRSRPRSRADPDSLPDRLPQRRTPVSRLRSGRGGFPVQAHRAGSAALQGGGVRRTQPQQRQAEGTGRRAAQAGGGAAEGRAEIPVAAGSRARRHGDVPRRRRNRHGQFADRSSVQLRPRQADLAETSGPWCPAGNSAFVPVWDDDFGAAPRSSPAERGMELHAFREGARLSRSRSASARCRPRKVWWSPAPSATSASARKPKSRSAN